MKERRTVWFGGILATGLSILALVAGANWALAHTKSQSAGLVGATAWASQGPSGYPGPLPSPQPSDFPPLPTPMPEAGDRLGAITVLSDKARLNLGTAAGPRFVDPASDGVSLVGEIPNDPPLTGGVILLIDLASGQSQRLAEVSDLARPQISPQYVVWQDQSRLHFLERATGKIGELAEANSPHNPRLAGSLVVWENLVSVGWEIRGYDLATGKAFSVTPGPRDDAPLISGNWVVYSEHTSKDPNAAAPGVNLLAVNLDTGRRVPLGSLQLPHNAAFPSAYYSIDAPWVVWNERVQGEAPSLHIYNLDTGQTAVAKVPGCGDGVHNGDPVQIVVSGHSALFWGCFQAMGYDLDQGQFFAVPIDRAETQPSAFVSWQFAKGQLVWVALVGEGVAGETRLYTASVLSP